MKTILLVFLAVMLWNSPEARDTTADLLRDAADWIETEERSKLRKERMYVDGMPHR